MSDRSRVLVAGRSSDSIVQLERYLEQCHDFDVETSVLVNGDNDPLRGVDKLPDVLILKMRQNSTEELKELMAHPAHRRPSLIVVGEDHDAECMRLAMQAGARDFLSEPVTASDLIPAVERIIAEHRGEDDSQSGKLTTFINAKGGSGASFLAASFGHICEVVDKIDTVLVDLDRQFASLPPYLDIEPAASIFDAFRVADELDEVAIDAFLGRHESGLCVMAGKHSVRYDEELQHSEAAVALFEILDRKFQRIVVEVPRHLDVLSVAALERSDHVVMVVQQSVPAIRDGARLKTILCSDLGIEADRVKVLVNRYQGSLYTELDDIRTALQVDEVFTVPNDFKMVSESVNMGVPIYQLGRKSPVTNALLQLRVQLGGKEDVRSQNLLSRSISALLRN